MIGKRATWNVRLGPNGPARAYRTQCKIRNHAIYSGDETVWLTKPMGLSCQACAEKLVTEAAA